MFQSTLPNFSTKEFPKDEESYNSRILMRAGFIDKLMAGVYSYLPLGLRVLRKIENIVRSHMDEVGKEILMPSLHPKDLWAKTGRWESLDVLFKLISRDKKEYALGPTHEEVIVPLAQKAIFSYRDLPFAMYQIQTKFRDEPRAKSGLLRGREFLMKDLYSFHATKEDLEKYYARVKDVYLKLFADIGLDAKVVEASGGTFSKYSHEFQVITEMGEDTFVLCKSCGFARNKEILDAKEGDPCPECKKPISIVSGSETGNIFELNTKYSEPFNLSYKDKEGNEQLVYMGCYGIGVSRLMGVVAEVFHDDKGLVWPMKVAPFSVHLVGLFGSDDKVGKKIYDNASKLYEKLVAAGVDVLFDDRKGMNPGEKFAEADLIGIPIRLVVSEKTGSKIEYKRRDEDGIKLMSRSSVLSKIHEAL